MSKTKIKSIRSTIFNKMVFTVCTASAAAVLAMLVIVCLLVSSSIKEGLVTATNHTAEYMNTLASSEEKLEFLHAMYDNVDDERKTLISPDGTVLYDSDAEEAALGNHKGRPEIEEAREYGSGEISRGSESIGRRLYYYAVQLEDGSVLRTSKPSVAMYKALLGLIPASVLLMLCIIAGTRAASRNVTTSIMRPIYRVDLNDLDENMIYPELMPFFKRIEAENAEKAKTEAIRREFTANVSHELKTPLTSISGYAQMINNGMAKPEDIALFGLKIEKEAERLLLLIDDIIRLSHLDETQTIDAEVINLNEIVAETINNLEPQLEKRNISLYYSGDDSYIRGRATMIGELASNIIDNAIKYNRDSGRIDVYVGKSPAGIEFSVADTGIGIAEEDIERIFERFYRVDKSHSKTVGGTGLGLSIVKHIVMIHDAKISVRSKLGEGTTIIVTFDGA